MKRLIRSILRNEKFIFEIVCLIMFVILFTRIANKVAKEKSEREEKNKYHTEQYFSNEEVLRCDETINEFLDLLQSSNTEEAYQLLSEKCKIEKFQNLEKFETEYYNKYFKGIKMYSKNIVSGDSKSIVYEIKCYYDPIETGKSENEKDYIRLEPKNEKKQIINCCEK